MKINIDKGKKGFKGCPCCGVEVSEYGPPDEEYYPYWAKSKRTERKID
jgi:hypothetical protein|tara:strand:+ start:321 stop:464 length:144 start_codon:yes stop_codon:yes gene_type:complete